MASNVSFPKIKDSHIWHIQTPSVIYCYQATDTPEAIACKEYSCLPPQQDAPIGRHLPNAEIQLMAPTLIPALKQSLDPNLETHKSQMKIDVSVITYELLTF